MATWATVWPVSSATCAGCQRETTTQQRLQQSGHPTSTLVTWLRVSRTAQVSSLPASPSQLGPDWVGFEPALLCREDARISRLDMK